MSVKNEKEVLPKKSKQKVLRSLNKKYKNIWGHLEKLIKNADVIFIIF